MTGPSTLQIPTVDDDLRAALQRVLIVGGAAFFLFLPLDLFTRASRYSDTTIGWCLGWRLGGAASIYGTWLLVRLRSRWSTTQLFGAGTAAMMLSLVATGFIAYPFGGIASNYLFAPAFYAVAIATFVPTHWRTALSMTAPAIALFLATVLIGVAAAGELEAQLADPIATATFTQHLLRILGVVGFAIISGHLLWRARMRLRDAHRLGRYLLRRPLGPGGMSEVWLAWDSHLKRRVALKLLQTRHPTDTRRARFEREARATSALHSPHTVRIYDFGEGGNGLYWIAMEYLHGMDLDLMLQTHGALEPRRALHFARQAALALAEAHQAGIVHRDIKPANLMASSPPGNPDLLKVLDFGIARQLYTEEQSLTHIGMIIGTPAFMAPEALAGTRADPTSDVWSFGATLYTMLTCTLPYDGNALAHRAGAGAPLLAPSERLGKPLPAELDELVMRCLRWNPGERPSDGAALVEALDAIPLEPWTREEARTWWSERGPTDDDLAAPPVSASAATERDVRPPLLTDLEGS